MSRRFPLVAAACAVGLLATGCTSTNSDPPTSSGGSSAPASAPSSSLDTVIETRPSLTPVTDAGLVTGPGVDDTSLSLGLLVDGSRDQGFSAGVRLWAAAFNSSGGVCGRIVELITASSAQSGADAYRYLAANSLGLITLPARDGRADLDAKVSADRLPAVTPEGTLSDLETTGSPIVLGATADILAINTAAHWMADGTLSPGSTVAVYLDSSDGDTDATDAATALGWWAPRAGIQLVVVRPDEQIPTAVSAIYAPGPASGVEQLLTRVAAERGVAPAPQTGLPTTTPTAASARREAVLTSGAGSPAASTTMPFLPSSTEGKPNTTGPTGTTGPASTIGTASTTGPAGTTVTSGSGSAPATSEQSGPGSSTAVAGAPIAVATDVDGVTDILGSATAAGAVTVASVTPGYTAAHPIGTALAQAFTSAGLSPGLRSFEGYAVGEAWGRVLTPMCAARTLTRSAATQQWTALAPAAADSIIGPTQPSNQLTGALPNSRVSALSVVDPSMVTGLRPLTLLESASGIDQYRTAG